MTLMGAALVFVAACEALPELEPDAVFDMFFPPRTNRTFRLQRKPKAALQSGGFPCCSGKTAEPLISYHTRRCIAKKTNENGGVTLQGYAAKEVGHFFLVSFPVVVHFLNFHLFCQQNGRNMLSKNRKT